MNVSTSFASLDQTSYTTSTTILHETLDTNRQENITKAHLSSYDENEILFWGFAFVCLSISIITIIGNGIVFFVSHQTRNTTRLRHLDGVVKSLAVTDFLFGLLGAPMIAVNYYLRKLFVYFRMY
jgi:hypothetical protein